MRSRFLKWMRMDDGHSINYMHVGEKRDTCHVRNKKYRQETAHDI